MRIPKTTFQTIRHTGAFVGPCRPASASQLDARASKNPAISLVLHACVLAAPLALMPQTGAASTTLTFDVTLPMVADNGRALDGRRVYLVPWEVTTENGPEPAICVTTDASETACAPERHATPPCPDSYRCTLSVTLSQPFESFTVSVFDMDGIPQDIRETSRTWLDQSLTALSDWTGSNLTAPELVSGLEETGVYWSWIESVNFVPLNEVGLPVAPNPRAQSGAREVASAMAGPHRIRFSKGRIAAPFQTMGQEECAAPLPPCVFTYVQILIEEELK